MSYQSSEIKAGIFIFIGFITLVGFLFILGNLQSYFKPKKEIQILFDNSIGLEVGTTVRYAGLEIGSIKSIDLVAPAEGRGPDKIRVLSEVDPSIIIKKNAIAMIKTEGLMGGFYIDIRPGLGESTQLAEGEDLRGQDSFEIAKVGDMAEEVVIEIKRFTDLASTLVGDAGKTLLSIQVSMENVNKLIMGELVSDARNTLSSIRASMDTIDNLLADNSDIIASNLKNLNRLSSELTAILEENSDHIRESFKNVSSVTRTADNLLTKKADILSTIIDKTDHLVHELDRLLKENSPLLTSLLNTAEDDLNQIAKSIDTATVNFDETFQQSSAILGENRRNLLELIRNMKDTSSSLKLLVEDVERNPWKLIRKSDEVEPPTPENNLVKAKDKYVRENRLDKTPAK
ncbi:MAG: MCE family protein [Nitrospinae bacterium]|nr:MCE family protein [Nitrospinota bacterium]